MQNWQPVTYWPAESPAIRRSLGIPSKVPGFSNGSESCLLTWRKRRFGAKVIIFALFNSYLWLVEAWEVHIDGLRSIGTDCL